MGNVMLASDLHRILAEAKAFTSKDKTLPQLGTVRIEAGNNGIIAVATDRYSLGASRANYDGDSFGFNLGASSVDSLIRISGTLSAAWRKDAAFRTVEIVVLDGFTALQFNFADEESITVKAHDESFPKWKQLVSEETIAPDAQVEATIGYNPKLLAKFCKVAGSRPIRVCNRGRAKATIITIGDEFVGVIMANRGVDEGYTKPNWL